MIHDVIRANNALKTGYEILEIHLLYVLMLSLEDAVSPAKRERWNRGASRQPLACVRQ